jgi:RNase P subunit RPR2
MHEGDERICDGCGQKLPPKSKLSEQTVSADGEVTVDLCLQCRIVRADREKRGS